MGINVKITVEIMATIIIMICSYWYLFHYDKKEEGINKKHLLTYLGIMEVFLIIFCIILHIQYSNYQYIHILKMVCLVSFIVPLAWKDYNERIIPNKIILVMLIFRMIYLIPEFYVYQNKFFDILKDNVLAFIFIGAFLILVQLLFKNSIGMGDIKLMIIMAFYQGFSGVFSSIFFSMIMICIFGIILLILKKKTRKDTLPFAPAILIGSYVSILMTGM